VRATSLETLPAEFAAPGSWSLPLLPHDAAQLPPKPLVQVLEARLDFR